MSLDPRMLLRGPAAEWEHTLDVPQAGGGAKKMLTTVVDALTTPALTVIVGNVIENMLKTVAPAIVEATAKRVMQLLDERAEQAKSRRTAR